MELSATPSLVRGPARNDYNGDGRPDLLWQSNTGELVVWTMNGVKVLGARSIANPGKTWSVGGHTDMNADGTTDLLLSQSLPLPEGVFQSKTVGWLLEPATGNVMTQGPFNPTQGLQIDYVGTGDVNLDGKGDLFYRQYNVVKTTIQGEVKYEFTDNGIYLRLVDGLADARPILLGKPGDAWSVHATNDLNADGISDVLLQNDDGTLVSWLLTASGGVSKVNQLGKPGPEWFVNSTGDFNGDGIADLVFRNKDGRASVWLMDEAGGVKAAKDIANPGNDWRIAQVEDLTGDGQADLVWMNSAGKVVVWEMAGTTISKADELATVGTDWTLIA